MIIVVAEVECILYEGRSLKNKRSVMKQLMQKIQNKFNVAIAETEYQDLWQRMKLGIVTISNEWTHAEQTIQQVLHVIDSFPELERTLTHVERL